mgnify:CR=1 FL=1
MINPNNLCMGCMNELSEGKKLCPQCGFSMEAYEQKRSDRALPPLTILAGKYLLGKVLGEGGFGITYLAWDLNRERKVAIKEYFPSGLAFRDTKMTEKETVSISGGAMHEIYERGLKSFTAEAENLRRFQQTEGIVKVFDFIYENDTAYIVMEYAQGKTLKKVLEEYGGTMPYRAVLQIMKPLLEALGKIHKENIIHRDISPENIILDQEGKATLIDFGAARISTGNETKSMTIVLKHGYAPVEQYLSRGRQGSWTDIYAICATMYHLITGVIPQEATERMLEDTVVPIKRLKPEVPLAVTEAIEKGLAVKWEKRYQNVEELVRKLYGKAPENERLQTFDETAAIPEIAAFGPWIYEVCEKYPVPSLFEPYVSEEMYQAEMLIKIPRNIERKEAKPWMNLYDYLIAVCKTKLYVLERVDDQVKEYSIPYADILGIQIFNDLLIGEMVLFTSGRIFRIPYNAVSAEIMNHFLALVREKSFSLRFPEISKKMSARHFDEGFLSHFFRTELLKLHNANERFVPIHYKREEKRQSYSIPGWLHLINDAELLVLQKGKPGKAKDDDFSVSLLYVPLGKLKKLKSENSFQYPGLKKYVMKSEGTTFLIQMSMRDDRLVDVYQKLFQEIQGRRDNLMDVLNSISY